MIKQEQSPMNDPKPNTFTRVSMEPLYERLLKKPFPDSVTAIEYCRSVCAEFGFTVKQEASANRNIYVYCSREGLPDSQRNPKPSPQRKRPSKRCDCRWRVVLSENEQEQWEFRKSMNPNASEHNHEMMSPDEMVKAWPPEVNDTIIQLARKRLQTHEIREAVKQQFPNITWNERRFYNRLTEERKRIRQRGVVERSQRLLLLSARLCSIVANHEDWAFAVENDLQRMFENFCQLARLTPENISTLVDLEPEMIQLEQPNDSNNSTPLFVTNTQRLSISNNHEDDDIMAMMASPTKKRRSLKSNNDTAVAHSKGSTAPETQKGIQMVHIPSYTIQIRTSPSAYRSPSYEPPNNTMKRMYSESSPSFIDSQQQSPLPPPQAFGSTPSFFPLASPTSSSSSSSSMVFQPQQSQRHTMNGRGGVGSPQQSMQSPNEFVMASQSYSVSQHPNQHHEANAGSNANYTTDPNSAVTSASATTNAAYSTSFPPYTIPTTAFSTNSSSVPFGFETNFITQQQRGDRLTTTQEFFGQIKEDPNQVEQQQQTMLRQHEYEQRMHRNNSNSFAHQNYSLPMIRSGDNSNSIEESHWS